MIVFCVVYLRGTGNEEAGPVHRYQRSGESLEAHLRMTESGSGRRGRERLMADILEGGKDRAGSEEVEEEDRHPVRGRRRLPPVPQWADG